jgi:uncharacterized protein YkwD
MRLPPLVLTLTMTTLAACGGDAKRSGQPSWRQRADFDASKATVVVPTDPVTFAPGGSGALYFGLPPQPAPASPLGDAVTRAVASAAATLGKPAPVADGRLFAAAAALAPMVPDEGVISYELVEFALAHVGIVEPSPHLLVVWGDLAQPDDIVAQLAPRLPELLSSGADARLGVGAFEREGGQGVVVFALQASRIALAPVARQVALGGMSRLEGKVLGAFAHPEVFVTAPGGDVARLPIRATGATDFAVDVPCTVAGRQQLEVTAEDATGTNVLANFPVWCGQAPPSSMVHRPVVDDAPVASSADAEQQLLALVNRDRATAGLPELRWDERLAAVGRKHSEEMQRTGVVGHVSPTTGAAIDRVNAAGVRAPMVLENVARAYGVGEAHAGLMNSPGHRANILSGSATHLGIGVVLGAEVAGRREMLVTQVFIRVPPPIEPGAAAAAVLATLQNSRRVSEHTTLSSAATELAGALARGVTRETAWATAKHRIEPLADRFRRIGTVITAVGDLASLDGDALMAGYAPGDVGVGVAQGPHPDLGDNAIWVVLLLGERR